MKEELLPSIFLPAMLPSNMIGMSLSICLMKIAAVVLQSRSFSTKVLAFVPFSSILSLIALNTFFTVLSLPFTYTDNTSVLGTSKNSCSIPEPPLFAYPLIPIISAA